MKTRFFSIIIALCTTVMLLGKDIKTVVLTTSPEMHCQNCENRIKSNIRFEKGVKKINTDLKNKTVTIEYDTDKTNLEKISSGFKKINYDVAPVNTKEDSSKE